MYEIEIDPLSDPPPAPPESSLRRYALDPTRIEDLSDAELDELPFGVICVGLDGTILRYNIAEARLARLDRALVLGKKFFSQVAPCTAVPEFQGRFEAFLQASRETVVQRFQFLFDFKFGAQLVTIEMVRSRLGDRAYFLVNRDQILPVRPEASAPALSVGDLEGSSPAGVLRNERAERFLRLGAASLQSLFTAATRAGMDAPRLFEGWGFEGGRVAVFDLETLALEHHGASLHALRLGDTLALLSRHFQEQGLGDLRFDLDPTPTTGAILVHLENSMLLGALRCPPAQRHGFHEGYLRALFTHLASRRLAVRYLAASPDDPATSCSYLVLEPGRLPALEGILAAAPASPAEILDQLARTLAP
jgi:photoactive yellow protein